MRSDHTDRLKAMEFVLLVVLIHDVCDPRVSSGNSPFSCRQLYLVSFILGCLYVYHSMREFITFLGTFL